MRKLLLSLVAISGLFSLTGCVVYAPPPPYVYAPCPVYGPPAVVVVGGYHRGYYR